MATTDGPPAIVRAAGAALAAQWHDAPVDVHETHGSWVVVAGERALKIKKPLVLPFLDYGTLARRRAMCREEVRINRRLAPDLYLGTVGLVARDGAIAIDLDDEAPGTTEVGVLMRRFGEDETLAARVTIGSVTRAQVRSVGARLAAFHAAHARPGETETALSALRAAVRTTLDDLDADAGGILDAARVRALRGRMEAVLAGRGRELLRRGARGLVVDGHGDLRAEHVLVRDPPEIVDAVEFDPSLRIGDTTTDLGFLVMDLQGMGHAELAGALVDGYREAGGDPGDDALLATMACYRALVRAKVDLIRVEQGGADAAERARARLAQAARFGWRALGPLALVVRGPPASGKSTLAAAVAAESGATHLSSDIVRKDRLGLASTERAPDDAYSREQTLATYRELGERAAAEVRAERAVVVDATLGDPDARAALREGLGPGAERMVYVECRVPAATAEARARERGHDPARVSDADAAVTRRLTASWAPLDEVPATRHLPLRADRPVSDLLADLWAWLDRTAFAASTSVLGASASATTTAA